MFVQTDFSIPPDNQNSIIWRYMDLSKLISLLEYKALYFARIDYLEDSFEGNWPKIDTNIVPIQAKSYKATFIKSVKSMRDHFRQTTFVNCWHLNNEESMAMWKIYSRQNEGIAIVSSFDRLKKSISDSRGVFIGKVFYGKDKVSPGPFKIHGESPFIKRSNFEYEKEIRAVCWSSDHVIKNSENIVQGVRDIHGLNIKINRSILIDKIIVSPIADKWFVELINEIVVHRYGLKVEVKKSTLLDYNL